jgi:predicted phosphodiesterase
MPWDEKLDLYERYQAGEDVHLDGIKDNSLRRYLRRFAKEMLGEDASVGIKENNEDLNHKVLSSLKGSEITTLDQLLEYCNVDLEEWKIDRYIVNNWHMGRKDKQVSMRWIDGVVVEGELEDSGKIHKEGLTQVKVWLVRRNPVPINPTIQSVSFSFDYQTPTSKKTFYDHSALIIPDTQFGFTSDPYSKYRKLVPFHDRRVLDIALQILQEIKVSKVIFLGDMLDLPDWSDKFLRSPEFVRHTQPAIIEASWWLSKFRQEAQDADIDVIEGNHDKRLRDAIAKHVPWAYGLRSADAVESFDAWSIPNLLGFDNLDIDWYGGYPNNEVWLGNGHTRVIHGNTVSAGAGMTASKIARESHVNTIFGHIHRREFATNNLRYAEGTDHVYAFSPGTACKIDGTVPGSTLKSVWQQGLALVRYDIFDSVPFQIPVTEGVGYLYDGTVRSREEVDIVAELVEDVGEQWEF